jgi:site-specific recombinase XerD
LAWSRQLNAAEGGLVIKSRNSEGELVRINDDKTIESSLISTELIKRYKEDCEMKGMSKESVRRYLSSINIFIQFLNEKEIDLLGLDRELLRQFLEYLRKTRKVSYNTLKNYFSALSTLYEFLEYEEYIEKNPVPSVRSRYVRRLKDNYEGQMKRLISVEEMTRLINSTLDVRDKAVIAFSEDRHQTQ